MNGRRGRRRYGAPDASGEVMVKLRRPLAARNRRSDATLRRGTDVVEGRAGRSWRGARKRAAGSLKFKQFSWQTLRGCSAAAPLKLDPSLQISPARPGSPRLFSRGPIEARGLVTRGVD